MSAEFRPVPLPPRTASHGSVHVDPVHELLSGEAVAIDVQPVGVVFRALGALIDIAVSFAVLLLFGWLGSWAGEFGLLDEATSRILMVVTIVIAAVTLVYQLLDPVFVSGVLGVGAWFAAGIVWFALVGRHRLVLSPEEAFALKARGSVAD